MQTRDLSCHLSLHLVALGNAIGDEAAMLEVTL
jgi:hypothetical protein